MSTQFEIQADILAFEQYKDTRRQSDEANEFALGISHFAQMHYSDTAAIEEEEELLGEMFELREKKRRIKEWLKDSKIVSPPKFFIKFKLETQFSVIDIDTSKMSKGEFNNTWRAAQFVKKYISAKIPNWQEDYTFQFSFQEMYGKTTGKTVYFMIPALRRKMDSPSRFAIEKGMIKNIRVVEDNLIQPLKQYEVEQHIIDGELDNIDLFQIDYYSNEQLRLNAIKKAYDDAVDIATAHPTEENFKKAQDIYNKLQKVDSKLNNIESRIDALKEWQGVEWEFDTRQRAEEDLQEDEAIYYSALLNSSNPEEAEYMLEEDPYFNMNMETADYILSTMSDERIGSVLGCTITGLMNLINEEFEIDEQRSKRLKVRHNTNILGQTLCK